MGNSFGTLFKVTTFGESHGSAIGVIVDGCPAGLYITAEEIQYQLDRRKPGQSKITTSRAESDRVQILSGILDNITLGTSISLLVPNKDAKSSAYDELKELYRPGHADFTYEARYSRRDWRGGGRASARETVARVAAGAVAGKMIQVLAGAKTLVWVEEIHKIKADIELKNVTAKDIEANIVRCPDARTAEKMIEAINQATIAGDSLGGKIKFLIKNCPAGLGAPVFDKLTADMAKACMSIPASRSISFGLGEAASEMKGHEHNDPFILKENSTIGTETNHAGGMLGGITNGEQIYGTVSFKPTATIGLTQKTVTRDMKEINFKAGGRHDPCVLPRAVPIVEGMLNIVIADHLLRYSIASIERVKKTLQ